jgi:hypothetical protein
MISAIFMRFPLTKLDFQHAKCDFQCIMCDFGAHECDVDTLNIISIRKASFNTHK